MIWSSRPPDGMTALGLDFANLWPSNHAQPLAIEREKKNGGAIYSSRRLLDVGNRRGDFDGDNVAGLVWVPEFRYGLRIPFVGQRVYN